MNHSCEPNACLSGWLNFEDRAQTDGKTRTKQTKQANGKKKETEREEKENTNKSDNDGNSKHGNGGDQSKNITQHTTGTDDSDNNTNTTCTDVQKELLCHGVVQAIKSIKKGEEILIDYSKQYEPTHTRRMKLLRSHQFLCCCDRCQGMDVTRTFMCPVKDCSGLVSPSSSFLSSSLPPSCVWRCDGGGKMNIRDLGNDYDDERTADRNGNSDSCDGAAATGNATSEKDAKDANEHCHTLNASQISELLAAEEGATQLINTRCSTGRANKNSDTRNSNNNHESETDDSGRIDVNNVESSDGDGENGGECAEGEANGTTEKNSNTTITYDGLKRKFPPLHHSHYLCHRLIKERLELAFTNSPHPANTRLCIRLITLLLEGLERVHGRYGHSRAKYFHSLARQCLQMGDHEEAITHYRMAYNIRSVECSEEHPLSVALQCEIQTIITNKHILRSTKFSGY